MLNEPSVFAYQGHAIGTHAPVPSPDAQGPVVSVDGLVHWLRITPATVAQLRNSGVFAAWRNPQGEIVADRFDLFESFGRYLSHLRAKLKQKPTSELQQANLARTCAHAETFTLRNELLKGTLCRMDDVDAVVSEMCVSGRSNLMGFGAAVSMLLVGKENHEEITRIINEQMKRALRDLKPPDPEAIRDRNRKMKEYTTVMAAFDEGGKARVRNRSKTNGTGFGI
jgi:hypothetical protein